MRRPFLTGGIGIAIVALLMIPAVQLNAAEAQANVAAGAKTQDAVDRAAAADRRRHLTWRDQAVRRADRAQRIAFSCRRHGRPPRADGRDRRRGRSGRLEAQHETSSWRLSRRRTALQTRRTGRSRTCRRPCFPALERSSAMGHASTLGGTAPEDRDFVHAVYGKFPLRAPFVIVLTLDPADARLPLAVPVRQGRRSSTCSRSARRSGSSSSSSSRATARRRSGTSIRRTRSSPGSR